MSQDFINANIDPALAEKIANARSAEEIRELCRQAGINSGALVRDEAGFVSQRVDLTAPQPTPRGEAQSDSLLKRAVRLPDNSIQLITAYSDTGLDALQRALRAQEVKL